MVDSETGFPASDKLAPDSTKIYKLLRIVCGRTATKKQTLLSLILISKQVLIFFVNFSLAFGLTKIFKRNLILNNFLIYVKGIWGLGARE